MPSKFDDFHQFEHESWQRVAGQYDLAWSGLVRPFVRHLIDAVAVSSGTRLLDVACGLGYVAEAAHGLGAIATGVDFSSEMIRLARDRVPQIEFREGDAQSPEFEPQPFSPLKNPKCLLP